jgi:tetratricopeptide (TPR) repeat protein
MNVQTALEHHLAGRLLQAEALYQQILQAEPSHPDALYLSGVMARQVGKQESAIAPILKAIAENPYNYLYYNTLCDVLRDGGQFDEAAIRYRQAFACKPDCVDALFNLGNVLQQQRQFDDAVVSFNQALVLRHDYSEILHDRLVNGDVFLVLHKLGHGTVRSARAYMRTHLM